MDISGNDSREGSEARAAKSSDFLDTKSGDSENVQLNYCQDVQLAASEEVNFPDTASDCSEDFKLQYFTYSDSDDSKEAEISTLQGNKAVLFLSDETAAYRDTEAEMDTTVCDRDIDDKILENIDRSITYTPLYKSPQVELVISQNEEAAVCQDAPTSDFQREEAVASHGYEVESVTNEELIDQQNVSEFSITRNSLRNRKNIRDDFKNFPPIPKKSGRILKNFRRKNDEAESVTTEGLIDEQNVSEFSITRNSLRTRENFRDNSKNFSRIPKNLDEFSRVYRYPLRSRKNA